MKYYLMYDWTNYVDAYRYSWTWIAGTNKYKQLRMLKGVRHVLHGRFVSK